MTPEAQVTITALQTALVAAEQRADDADRRWRISAGRYAVERRRRHAGEAILRRHLTPEEYEAFIESGLSEVERGRHE